MTWPASSDLTTVRRMRSAHANACAALDVVAAPDAQQAWGWRGRTFGMPVAVSGTVAWLRIAAARTGHLVSTFWNGGIDAQRSMPSSIPRPQLLDWHDWTDRNWNYRGELYEHAGAPTAAPQPIITASVDLPGNWLAAARSALDAISAVPTNRRTIQPGFLAWAMPRYLGIRYDAASELSWTTAHGDFHFANLTAPRLTILDWEGWGLAPPGYDAATLHSYSILAPDTAQQIRHEFAHLLDSDTGRQAELVVITDLLHSIAQGTNPALAGPLRHRAELVLGRSLAD